jgi:hypothetical protein
MTRLFLAVPLVIVALAGCASNPKGSGGLFGPEVVTSNDHYITLSDMIGIPGATQRVAENHCSQFGKAAVFASKSGDGFQCSNGSCVTYTCQ